MSRIMFVGLGGVGGYVGGVFADVFEHVTFVARNGRKASIQENGLHLVSDIKGDLTVRPEMVTDTPEDAGVQDYIFICVKNYSLEKVCRQIAPAVDDHTVVLPIMNGVEPGDMIRKYLGKGIILDSLIYIVSSAEKDYSIRQLDNYARIHVGKMDADAKEQDAVRRVAALFEQAGIDCVIEQDISAAIWKKYIFNCAYNVSTARFLCDAGDIRKDEVRMQEFIALLKEAFAVALAKGVHVEENWLSSHEHRMRAVVSDGATSSLKRDIEAGRQSEAETFGGYIVKEAEKYGVHVPVSRRYYEALEKAISENKAGSLL